VGALAAAQVRIFLALLVFLASAAGAAESTKDRWNLADLYPSVEAWRADGSKLEAQMGELARCHGQLGRSAERLQGCLDALADLQKRHARIEVYASEKLSEDTGVAASLELQQHAQVLSARLEEASAFVKPEILKLGRPRVERMVAGRDGLRIYRHMLDNILRAAPHTLDKPGEEIIAAFALTNDSAYSTYSILANADMPWPKVRLADGTEAVLDQTGYGKHRAAQNRADRKAVFDTFWGKWREFERTMGVALYSQLKTAAVQRKLRKYSTSIEASLDKDRLPLAVYDTLVAQANANLPTLHRYFRLRARMLGVTDMRYYDVYPPLVKSELRFPYDRGRQLLLESARPLGGEYVAALAKGLDSRWMDLYPRPRKKSGAHMNGGAYDVHPYVLMNYQDDYDSVSTLVHEWGHAMHSHLSNRAQPFVNADYATFVAEIAAILNEALLLEHVLKTAKSDEERLLFLGEALEGLRGTFFRQTMFAEFERAIHARVDAGQTLTGAEFTRIYGELLRRYHGDAQGVVKIDELYSVEWAYIPHFYYSFYVFQYATSIAAASQLADAILKGEPGANERTLRLLSAGGSDYPYELVKAAGVDLATPAPYQALVARMNRIMDEIEAILSRGAR
jgi:oligoendopeptidase F